MTRNVNMKKYIGIFAIVHLAMIIVIAVVFNLLDMEGNAGLNMGILIGSAMAAGHYFLKDHQRLPTSSEKAWLALLSLLASILVSVVFFAGIAVLEPEGLAAIGGMLLEQWSLMAMILSGVSLLYLLLLWLSYGPMLKRQFAAMQKKNRTANS